MRAIALGDSVTDSPMTRCSTTSKGTEPASTWFIMDAGAIRIDTAICRIVSESVYVEHEGKKKDMEGNLEIKKLKGNKEVIKK